MCCGIGSVDALWICTGVLLVFELEFTSGSGSWYAVRFLCGIDWDLSLSYKKFGTSTQPPYNLFLYHCALQSQQCFVSFSSDIL